MAAQALQTLMHGRQLPAKPRHLGALQVRDLGERAGSVMAQHGCQGPSGDLFHLIGLCLARAENSL